MLPAPVKFQCDCVGQQSYELRTYHQLHWEQGSGEERHGSDIVRKALGRMEWLRQLFLFSASGWHSKLYQSVSKNGTPTDRE